MPTQPTSNITISPPTNSDAKFRLTLQISLQNARTLQRAHGLEVEGKYARFSLVHTVRIHLLVDQLKGEPWLQLSGDQL